MLYLHLTLTQQFVLAVQVGFGLLLFLAAFPKLVRLRGFIATVRAYRLLPPTGAPLVAIVLLVAEFALAIAFVFSLYVPIAVYAAGVLLVLFATAVAINLRRNSKIACGCFGGNEVISNRSLVRLAVLGSAVVLVAVLGPIHVHLPIVITHGGAGIRFFLTTVSTAGSLILSGAWLLTLPEVSHLFRPRSPSGVRS